MWFHDHTTNFEFLKRVLKLKKKDIQHLVDSTKKEHGMSSSKFSIVLFFCAPNMKSLENVGL